MSRSAHLNARSLDHLVLYVHDIERSKRFYVDLLGLSVDREHIESRPDGQPAEELDTNIRCFLRCGDNQIGLFQRDSDEERSRGDLNHFALALDSTNLEDVRRILAGAKVEVRSRLHDPSCIYINDPDGHTVQLLTG